MRISPGVGGAAGVEGMTGKELKGQKRAGGSARNPCFQLLPSAARGTQEDGTKGNMGLGSFKENFRLSTCFVIILIIY